MSDTISTPRQTVIESVLALVSWYGPTRGMLGAEPYQRLRNIVTSFADLYCQSSATPPTCALRAATKWKENQYPLPSIAAEHEICRTFLLCECGLEESDADKG